MTFANQTVWITGASSGIGEALAYAFDREGAHVILSARRKEKLQEVIARMNGPGKRSILEYDVSQTDMATAKFEEARRMTGQLDILINNAGISQRSSVEETLLYVDREIFEVNFFGNIALTKAVLPHLIKRQKGHIVVISSVAGKLATPFRSTYAASKHALHGWYDALRAEVADRGVSVNMICPGYIKTNISVNARNATGDLHGEMDPGQEKGMSAEECAARILRAIQSDRLETIIGKEKIYVWIKKFLPGLYYRTIRKKALKREF